MNWEHAVLTRAGAALINTLLTRGDPLVISGARAGSGTCDDMEAATAMEDVKQTVSVTGVVSGLTGRSIRLRLTNTGLETGYRLRQIGVFAQNGQLGETLLLLMQDADGLDVPSATEMAGFVLDVDARLDFSGSQELEIRYIPEDAAGGGYLPIANETPMGSLAIPDAYNMQGMCVFKESPSDHEFMVFAIQHNKLLDTRLYLYDITDDEIVKIVNTQTTYGVQGHFNDMTYCDADHRIYVANYSEPKLDVFTTELEYVESISMTDFGTTSDRGRVSGIAWSESEQCFFLNFKNVTPEGGTAGLFRFSQDFSAYEQMPLDYGNMTRQSLHVERETGNVIQVKFRQTITFRVPHMNRLDIHTPKAEYVASVYMATDREVEGIAQMEDGTYVFGYIAGGGPGQTKRAAMFTKGVIRKGKGLYTTLAKYFLNQSNYKDYTNNIYYDENADPTKLMETGGADHPYRTWPSLYNFLHSSLTKTLKIHLLSDISYDVDLYFYDRNLTFLSEYSYDVDIPPKQAGSGTPSPSNIRPISPGLVLPRDDGTELTVCGGELDVLNRTLTVTHKLYTFDGTEDWRESGASGIPTGFSRFYHSGGFADCVYSGGNDNRNGVEMQSSHYPIGHTSNTDLGSLGAVFVMAIGVSQGNTVVVFQISDTVTGDTTDGVKAWLAAQYVAGTPVQVVYPMASPVEYELSDEEVDLALSILFPEEGDVPPPVGPSLDRPKVSSVAVSSCTGAVIFDHLDVGEERFIVDFSKRVQFSVCKLHQPSKDRMYDNDQVYFSGCDLSEVGSVDFRRTRLLGLYENTDYGAGTRLYGVSMSVRGYNDTTPEEQYAVRGITWAVPNMDPSTLTAIAQLRVSTLMSVSAYHSGRLTDLPDHLAGVPFGGEAVSLGPDRMLYRLAFGGKEYTRIVSFVSDQTDEGRSTAIGDDTGWMTGDNSTLPVNTVIGPEARAAQWGAGKLVILGDSIATSTHGGAWIDIVGTKTGRTVANYAVGSAGFVYDSVSLISAQVTAAASELPSAGVVVVAAGTNDAAHSDCSGTVFRAAVQGVIDGIRTLNATVPIIFITPLRREKDASAGSTTVQSRQRLVAAAICNTALMNDCHVISGFDIPIAVSASDWVADMTADGLHPEETLHGNMVYANAFLQAVR